MNILEFMETKENLPKQGTEDRTMSTVRDALEGEAKFLSNLYKDLPIPSIHVTNEVQGNVREDGTMSSYTFGDYNRRSQHINIYVGTLKKYYTSASTADIVAMAIETLAHEYQHHYQFHSINKNKYTREDNADRENNTPYRDKSIEVNARAAADWYIERRKPITVQF